MQELNNCGYETRGDVRRRRQARAEGAPLAAAERYFPVGRPSQHAHQGFRFRGLDRAAAAVAGVPAKLPGGTTDAKTHHLLERGSVAVVGSSTRNYSATGGAFSLAYFNALLYDGKSLGASLRQAKNFLVAYALLKEKRLGKDARLTGANLRSAWAFTLWGDPTIQLPAPTPPASAMSPVRADVRGNSIIVALPETYYEKIRTNQYVAQPRPNTCVAGLVDQDPENEKTKTLVPFVFSEVAIPKAPPNLTPRLRSRLPSSHYVFCWDARRRCGYLLVTPRPHDEHELRHSSSNGNRPARKQPRVEPGGG